MGVESLVSICDERIEYDGKEMPASDDLETRKEAFDDDGLRIAEEAVGPTPFEEHAPTEEAIGDTKDDMEGKLPRFVFSNTFRFEGLAVDIDTLSLESSEIPCGFLALVESFPRRLSCDGELIESACAMLDSATDMGRLAGERDVSGPENLEEEGDITASPTSGASGRLISSTTKSSSVGASFFFSLIMKKCFS